MSYSGAFCCCVLSFSLVSADCALFCKSLVERYFDWSSTMEGTFASSCTIC